MFIALNPTFKYILHFARKMKKTLLIFILLLFLAGCAQSNTEFSQSSLQQSIDTQEGVKPAVNGLKKGQMPPDFEITSVDNENVKLSSFSENKKPVLLYFFAS